MPYARLSYNRVQDKEYKPLLAVLSTGGGKGMTLKARKRKAFNPWPLNKWKIWGSLAYSAGDPVPSRPHQPTMVAQTQPVPQLGQSILL
jgi:hypothetical protein